MLNIIKVNTYYGKSHVLFDISMIVKRGEIVALVGRNGVGKSTTLRTIIGLTPPKNGKIIYKDKEISGRKPHQIAREGIGYVPEERCIFHNLSVHQNLMMGIKPGQIKNKGGDEWTFEKIYNIFPNLRRRRKQKGAVLSGEKCRC